VVDGCSAAVHAILVVDGCSAAMHAILVVDGCSAAMHAILVADGCSAAMHACFGGLMGSQQQQVQFLCFVSVQKPCSAQQQCIQLWCLIIAQQQCMQFWCLPIAQQQCMQFWCLSIAQQQQCMQPRCLMSVYECSAAMHASLYVCAFCICCHASLFYWFI